MFKQSCGIVILYHPEKVVFSNIASYTDALEKLWVIDNTEHDLQELQAYFSGAKNVEVIQDGNNAGIASRINFALRKALKEGYLWMLTMDQDSSFTRSNLSTYEDVIAGIDTEQNIALVGVEYGHQEKDPEKNILLKNTTSVITSGTFINLRVIEEIGFMNEDLFIDEVDSDFSYRVLIKGWEILVCDGIYLKHELGERVKVRSFKTGRLSNRGIYSPVRLYYITRNFLWVRKKYRSYFPDIFRIRMRQLFHLYKNSLLYNTKRIQTLRMIWKGYVDFKKNNLGKLAE